MTMTALTIFQRRQREADRLFFYFLPVSGNQLSSTDDAPIHLRLRSLNNLSEAVQRVTRRCNL